MTGDATDDAAENLALLLTQHGMQKAPARVLAAFLFADTETVTAGDLGGRLGMSSGAVSSAITMLRTVALIERAPAPGRREHYRMRDDAWVTLMSNQNAAVAGLMHAAEHGLAESPPGSPAHRRLADMRDFYAYLMRELPGLIDRWHNERDRT